MTDSREESCFSSRTGRLILAVAMAGLALAAGLNAYANAWRSHRPDLVLTVFPGDPIAMLNAQDHRWLASKGAADGSAQAAMAASQALRNEPLSPAAFRLLGFAETSARHPGKARALMTLAYQLSRRDAATLVWLIHDSAERGDMQATLLHYDEALRTSADTATVLFPPLAAAIFDPAVRHALSPYVRTRPTWMPRFLAYAADSGATPDHVAHLIIEAGGLPPTREYDGLHARILAHLVDKASMMLAESYLRDVVKMPPGAMSDARFATQTTDPDLGPFAWQFIDKPEIGAALDDRSALQVRVAADGAGVVAKRVLIARPGQYDLTQSVTTVPGMPTPRLRWEMRCLPAAPTKPVWAQDLPRTAASKIYMPSFTVPADCLAQELSLVAGNDDAQEASATIAALTLKPRSPPR